MLPVVKYLYCQYKVLFSVFLFRLSHLKVLVPPLLHPKDLLHPSHGHPQDQDQGLLYTLHHLITMVTILVYF